MTTWPSFHRRPKTSGLPGMNLPSPCLTGRYIFSMPFVKIHREPALTFRYTPESLIVIKNGSRRVSVLFIKGRQQPHLRQDLEAVADADDELTVVDELPY